MSALVAKSVRHTLMVTDTLSSNPIHGTFVKKIVLKKITSENDVTRKLRLSQL